MGIKLRNIAVVNDRYCKGCKYYRALTTGEQHYCNYIFAEDKKRPCDPGKDCTVRVEKQTRGKGE